MQIFKMKFWSPYSLTIDFLAILLILQIHKKVDLVTAQNLRLDKVPDLSFLLSRWKRNISRLDLRERILSSAKIVTPIHNYNAYFMKSAQKTPIAKWIKS